MSYNLSFAGHRDFESEAAARAFEEQVAEHARGIAATLDGLTSASGSFSHLGAMQLMPQPTDEPVAEVPADDDPPADDQVEP